MTDLKLDPKFEELFKDYKAVIFEPNSSTRLSIRKVLSDLGIPPRNIVVAQTFNDIKKHIKSEAPNLVFTVDSVEKYNGLELVADHLEALPERRNAAFFIVSNYNSIVTAAETSEYDVDYLVAKPFSPEGLAKAICNVFESKMEQSAYRDYVEQGKTALYSSKYDLAIEYFSKANDLDDRAICPHYFKARCYEEMGQTDEALLWYGNALSRKTDHYKALLGCFDIYFARADFPSALRYARILLKKHPINPKRIIQYIKLSIATKSYMDIVYYCELLEDVNRDEGVIKSIAAGLAVGAKFLLAEGSEEKLVRMCLQHASKYCSHFPLISISVTQSFLRLNEVDMAETILNNLKKTTQFENEETDILRVSIMFRRAEYPAALVNSLNLIKKKIFDDRVYEIAIRSAISIDRRPEFVEDLFYDAVKKFPSVRKLEPYVKSYCAK